MSFNTPFIPDNQPDALYDFSFFKIQRHTKSAIIGMMKSFFSTMNKTYKLQIPELVEVQNSTEATKLFIDRDFPYTQRKLPIIIVAIKSSLERKLYIGADNAIGWVQNDTSTGRVASEVFNGAADLTLSLIIVAQSSEERMRFAEMVNMCFTHYFRWQYFYTLGDSNMFSIVPNTQQLEFGTESEVNTDATGANFLYITDITMKVYVEYTFKDINIVVGPKYWEIDQNSGAIEFDTGTSDRFFTCVQ